MCVRVKQRKRNEAGRETRVSGIEREASVISHLAHREKPISHQLADMNDEFCRLKPILHRQKQWEEQQSCLRADEH